MNYDFTLDRKGIISVLGSSVLMGALLFVAGLIVGSYWTANGPTVSAAARKNAANLETLPQAPVLLNESPQAALAIPNKPAVNVSSGAVGPVALTANQEQPAGTAQAAPAQPAAAATEQAGDNKTENGAAGDGNAPPAAKADASSAPAQAVSDTDLVTVEVGTFLDANAANQLFKNLERKGYAPTFFTGRDAQSREWYAIRIGAYSDKQQAENAAANFTKQEKIKAKVRPFGSL
ncbi:MAG TPA: SPOR domain-containing protein [Pyrinomonadaceae bacterium]|nr:SPOR domain-containing protein [Pyrinomonadaceae bacterium]